MSTKGPIYPAVPRAPVSPNEAQQYILARLEYEIAEGDLLTNQQRRVLNDAIENCSAAALSTASAIREFLKRIQVQGDDFNLLLERMPSDEVMQAYQVLEHKPEQIIGKNKLLELEIVQIIEQNKIAEAEMQQRNESLKAEEMGLGSLNQDLRSELEEARRLNDELLAIVNKFKEDKEKLEKENKELPKKYEDVLKQIQETTMRMNQQLEAEEAEISELNAKLNAGKKSPSAAAPILIKFDSVNAASEAPHIPALRASMRG